VKIIETEIHLSITPYSSQTQLVVAANAGAADDFTDTINPYFDGDGNSGSISTFGTRSSIYYTLQGQGVGIRHKLNDKTELSVGYLARNGNNSAPGSGLLGGGFGALAQIGYQMGENSKIAVTYTRSLITALRLEPIEPGKITSLVISTLGVIVLI